MSTLFDKTCWSEHHSSMTRVAVPKNLYKVAIEIPLALQDSDQCFIGHFDNDIQEWFMQILNYIPDIETPLNGYIDLPTEELATEFKMRWY